MERLQKLLSAAGIASRRAAEELIRQGRVSLNGQTVTELGTRADLAHDEVRVDGRRVKAVARHRYLLVNKPKGYVTTLSDPQKRRTVLELIGNVRDYVYPVGRLDFDSEGLLLMTNDGDLAARSRTRATRWSASTRCASPACRISARSIDWRADRARRAPHGAGRGASRPRRSRHEREVGRAADDTT